MLSYRNESYIIFILYEYDIKEWSCIDSKQNCISSLIAGQYLIRINKKHMAATFRAEFWKCQSGKIHILILCLLASYKAKTKRSFYMLITDINACEQIQRYQIIYIIYNILLYFVYHMNIIGCESLQRYQIT